MSTTPNIKVSTINKVSNKFKVSLVNKLRWETWYSVEIILGLLQDDIKILEKYNMADPETVLDIPLLLRDLSSEAHSIVKTFFDDIIFAKKLRTMPLEDIDTAVSEFIKNGGKINIVIRSTILSRKKESQDTMVEKSADVPLQKIIAHSREKTISNTGLSAELLSLLDRWLLSKWLWWGGNHNKKKSQFHKK